MLVGNWIREGRFSVFFRFLLLIFDVIAINLSSYLALLVRFELKWSSIEHECLEAVNRLCVLNTIITVLIFFIFRLYNSLWRYASVREMVNIMFACIIASVQHITALFMCYKYFTKSYIFVYSLLLLSFVMIIRFSYRLSRHIFSLYSHGETAYHRG